jgi:hypothetical protein
MSAQFTNRPFLQWIYFLALVFICGACGKDEPAQPQPGPTPVVNERLLLQSSLFHDVDSIGYNADKTPKSLKIKGPGNLITISYAPDKVTYAFLKFDKTMSKTVYELENGVAKKLTFYSVDKDGKEEELATKLYFYKEGRMIKEVYSAPDQSTQGYYTEYFYDSSNENVSVMEMREMTGALIEKTTFEYSDILDKSSFINQWTTDMDANLFPPKAKYLRSAQTVEFNKLKAKSTFIYELDAQGYVVKGKRIDDKSPQKETIWINVWQ